MGLAVSSAAQPTTAKATTGLDLARAPGMVQATMGGRSAQTGVETSVEHHTKAAQRMEEMWAA